MSDLISRQDAIDCVGWGDSVTKVIDRIKSLQSAEPKTGEWVDNHNGTFTCDQCGCKHSKSNYCPNCGAKMER